MSQNKYRCLIVDDEVLGRELVASHLSQLSQFELVASCASAVEASEVLGSEVIDLLLLDIEMPVLKGTEFYKGLRNKPAVIFTTAYRDYALEGFEVEAVDYLLKPITFARFFRAMEKFMATHRDHGASREPLKPAEEWIFIRADRKDIRLKFSDITYVQGLKDYVCVFTRDKRFMVKETMISIGHRLGDDFARVHRSYIVNKHHVTAVTSQDVELGTIEVPIGDTFKATLREVLAR